MPRGGAPEWKKRKEPILDEYLQAVIDRADGQFHPETGQYGTLHYTGIDTRERAAELKKALYRSAYHLKVSLATKVIKADDGSFTIEFTVINKAHARAYVLQKYGTDRSKWAYDPRRKGKVA